MSEIFAIGLRECKAGVLGDRKWQLRGNEVIWIWGTEYECEAD